MGSAIGKDVPAYVLVTGAPAAPRNINLEGLKRRGFSKEEMQRLSQAYKIIYRRGLTLEDSITEIESTFADCNKVAVLVDSLKSSSRGIVR